MFTKILFALFTLLFNLFIVSPAFAGTPVWGTDLKAGEFKCGSAQEYESGATTIATVASAAAQNWTTCEREYGSGMCSVMAKGFTVGPRGTHCDYDQKLHDPLDHALADARAEQLYQAFASLVPGTDIHRLPNDLHWDTAVRAAYLIIRPKPEAQRLPANPDERWAFATGPIMRASDNICPTFFKFDAVTQTYTTQFATCECSNPDNKPETPALEVYSDVGWSQIARKREKADLVKDLTFTEVRLLLEEGMTSYVIEINENGDEEMTPDGLGVTFLETGSTLTVRFPNRCERKLMADAEERAEAEAEAVASLKADRLAGYGIDGVVAFTGHFGGAVLGDGRELTTHPFGGGAVELGVEAGGLSPVAFIATVGVGVSIDDNCVAPASVVLPQVRLGATLNRQGIVGGIIDVRGRLSWAPSVAITPDDPTTEGNEYQATSAIGLVSPGFVVEGGPRFAFGRDGVKRGFIAVTAGFGPTWRWVEPTPGDQRVTLTGDASVNLALGWSW